MKISILIYVLAWVLAVTGTAVLIISGNINEITVPVVGLAFSALFFTGVIGLLPWWLDRTFAPKLKVRDRGARGK